MYATVIFISQIFGLCTAFCFIISHDVCGTVEVGHGEHVGAFQRMHGFLEQAVDRLKKHIEILMSYFHINKL